MILSIALAATLAAAPAVPAAPDAEPAPPATGDDVLLRELRPRIDAASALLRDAHAREVDRTIRLVRRRSVWSDVVTAVVFLTFECHESASVSTQHLAVFVRPQQVPDDPPVGFSLLAVLPIAGTSVRALDVEQARITERGEWLDVEVPGHLPGPRDLYREMSVPTRARFRISTHAGGQVAELPDTGPRRRAPDRATSPASP